MSADEFERDIMCKPASENIEAGMAFFETVVILDTKPGLLTVLGRRGGSDVPIQIIQTEETLAPWYVWIDGKSTGSCQLY